MGVWLSIWRSKLKDCEEKTLCLFFFCFCFFECCHLRILIFKLWISHDSYTIWRETLILWHKQRKELTMPTRTVHVSPVLSYPMFFDWRMISLSGATLLASDSCQQLHGLGATVCPTPLPLLGFGLSWSCTVLYALLQLQWVRVCGCPAVSTGGDGDQDYLPSLCGSLSALFCCP